MAWTPFTRRHHDRSGMRYASDLTDREWSMIEPFMPSQPERGRRRKTSLRAVMDAVFYLLQSGCQWALLPHDFPPKSTVHHYFKRFCRDGTWRRIHDALYCRTRQLEGREEQPSLAIIDSQSAKTGPDARHGVGFDAGKKIRVLTMVDTFSRYVPVLDPRFSYRAEDVVRTLERVCLEIGYPKTIRIDQGSEFVSRDLDLWAYTRGVTLDFSRPGKPTDNAYIEAFNGRFRVECLNDHWFLTLVDAAEKMEDWRRYYNPVS